MSPEEPTPCPRAAGLIKNKHNADTKTLASKVDFIIPPGPHKTSRISFSSRPKLALLLKSKSLATKALARIPFCSRLTVQHPALRWDSGSFFRSHPLGGIQNYDSPYHVLSTNVKTEVCSPSMRSVMPHGQCAILTSFSGSVGADCAPGPARKIVIVDFVYRRRMSR